MHTLSVFVFDVVSSNDTVGRAVICVIRCLSILHVINPSATAAW